MYDFGKVLQEADGAGTTGHQYLSTDRQYGDLVSGYGGGRSRYYEFDALGSAEALLDDTGGAADRYAYRAFGLASQTAGADPNPFTWVGRQFYARDPETDLYLLGAGGDGRYYDPPTARFLTPDPLEDRGGHPNYYAYCGNDPVNRTDPSGQRILFQPWNDDCKATNLLGERLDPKEALKYKLLFMFETNCSC